LGERGRSPPAGAAKGVARCGLTDGLLDDGWAVRAGGALKDPNVEKVVRGVGAALVAMVARR
jgi:hypothetical protein